MAFPTRALTIFCCLAALSCGAPAEPICRYPEARNANLEDFQILWQFVQNRYAFFDEKSVSWTRVYELYAPRAAAATSRDELMHVLEATLDELYDGHCMLNTNSDSSWRPVPHDIYVELINGEVKVTTVRQNSDAALAGIRVGQRILSINDAPVLDVARTRLPQSLTSETPETLQWALLSAVAGRHGDIRRLRIVDGTEERDVVLSRNNHETPSLSFAQLDDGIGLITIHSFADEAIVPSFDSALNELRNSAALVIDVRSNGGGDTAVAVPIMGRFITTRQKYALMTRRDGAVMSAAWAEYVEPRGPWTYERPVVILVDRFSVSMAEGFAMGMHGMGRASIVGTRMAGLGAGVHGVTLPNSGISAQISTEPVFHVNGIPRSQLVPDVLVDPAGSVGDAILEAGLRQLRSTLANSTIESGICLFLARSASSPLR